jgi:hypothetical protein
MNSDLRIWLGSQELSEYTSVICKNSSGGTCFVLYLHRWGTAPRLCHSIEETYTQACHDCPMVSAFEMAYTEFMRKKKTCSD